MWDHAGSRHPDKVPLDIQFVNVSSGKDLRYQGKSYIRKSCDRGAAVLSMPFQSRKNQNRDNGPGIDDRTSDGQYSLANEKNRGFGC